MLEDVACVERLLYHIGDAN